MISQDSISGESHSSTPSPESVDGLSPSGSPGGRKTSPSGLEAARANLSLPPEKAPENRTPDTYGQSSGGSSPSAVLQSSLESKLRARLEGRGSPEYALTWKHWDIKSGPRICALRASAPRISGRGSSGWPTTRAADGTGHYSGMRYSESGEPIPDALPEASKLAGWPKTPQASDGEGGVMEIRPGTTGKYKLRDYAQLAGWTTPQAHDTSPRGKGQKPKHGTKHGCADLNADAATVGWPTPKEDSGGPSESRTGRGFADRGMGNLSAVAKAASGLTPESSPVPTGFSVALDAAFSRWLMGYPEVWDSASPGFADWLNAQEEIVKAVSKATETQ